MLARVLSAAGIALVALLLWRSVFSVDATEVAIVTRFGRLLPGIREPGVHLALPVDDVHRLDRRLLTRSFAGESFLSQDQKPLSVDFYLRWRLVDPTRYFEATGGDEEVVATRLGELIRSQIRAAPAAVPPSSDVSDPQAGAAAVRLDALHAPAVTLGVAVVDAQLQRIALPDEAANAVYQRMQQMLVAQAQQLRAQGSAEADKIRSDAEHKRAQILADATRDAQRIRGEADSAAAADYARGYGANPEFAAFSRTLQAYKSSLGREGDVLVLSPEGEFFKYLHSASGR